MAHTCPPAPRGPCPTAESPPRASTDRPAGDGQVTVLVDVAGALPAQLQGDGRQVLGSRRHHNFAHSGAAGVEDVIESLLQQLGRLRYSSSDHRVQLLGGKQEPYSYLDLKQMYQARSSAWGKFTCELH